MKAIKNRSKDTNENVVNWLKIKQFCYLKSEPDAILFKYDLDAAEFFTLQVSRSRGKTTAITKVTPASLFACQEKPKISTAKYNDLQDLCRTMCTSQEYHAMRFQSRILTKKLIVTDY